MSEEQAPYGLKENIPDYSDLHHYRGRSEPVASYQEDQMKEIMYTLTKAQRMIGQLLPNLDKEDRQYYLEQEQSYRNVVRGVIKLSSEK